MLTRGDRECGGGGEAVGQTGFQGGSDALREVHLAELGLDGESGKVRGERGREDPERTQRGPREDPERGQRGWGVWEHFFKTREDDFRDGVINRLRWISWGRDRLPTTYAEWAKWQVL